MFIDGSIYVLSHSDTHGDGAIPENGAPRHNARREMFAAFGARRMPIAHFGVAATAGAGALVLAARRVLGSVLDWGRAGGSNGVPAGWWCSDRTSRMRQTARKSGEGEKTVCPRFCGTILKSKLAEN